MVSLFPIRLGGVYLAIACPGEQIATLVSCNLLQACLQERDNVQDTVQDHDVEAQDEKGDFGDEEDGDVVILFLLMQRPLAFANLIYSYQFSNCK